MAMNWTARWTMGGAKIGATPFLWAARQLSRRGIFGVHLGELVGATAFVGMSAGGAVAGAARGAAVSGVVALHDIALHDLEPIYARVMASLDAERKARAEAALQEADIPQHASYIESWLEVLRRDRRAIFSAAADAQRIADWCLERHPAYRAAHEEKAEVDDIATATAATEPTRTAIPAPVAALGPMPAHIARRINPKPAAAAVPAAPIPLPEEAPTWTYAPR